jgi:hypothetical protein
MFQLGCIVGAGDASILMDEYMSGGLADLAGPKSPAATRAEAVQCIAMLALVSDDGPEDTFTALLSVLAPVMTLRAFALGRGLSLARCGFWDAKTTKNDSCSHTLLFSPLRSPFFDCA